MQVEERLAAASLYRSAAGRWIGWIPSPQGVFKVNFDAAFYDDGASLACVICDDRGSLLLAARWNCMCCDVLEAETRATWRSICLLSAQFQNELLWLEGDAQVVVQGADRKRVDIKTLSAH